MDPKEIITKSAVEVTKAIAADAYKDISKHPATKELGKAFTTLAKTINVALTPLSVLVWGYDNIKDYIVPTLEDKLKHIPKEKITTPDPMVAGPTLEALRFAGHNENLRELYANLLATSMNTDTSREAHPAFVEILKQLNPDEAKLLSYMSVNTDYPVITVRSKSLDGVAFIIAIQDFSLIPYEAKCECVKLGPSYLENLARLGLIEISYITYVIDPPNSYDALNNHPFISQLCDLVKSKNRNAEIQQGSISFTELGRQFYSSCIK